MSCSRLMNNNFIDEDILVSHSVTSEDPEFPEDNLYLNDFRSKVWRSEGFWEISSSNNTVVFNIGGSNVTGTVATGSYDTTEDFLNAVETAFNSAAAGTYTFTQASGTYKVTLAKSTGTFNIIWTDANSSGFADLIGFDISSDSTGSLTYTADELKIHSYEAITWDLGISTNPTSFIAIANRNQPLSLTPQATIKLQANQTDNFSTPSFEIDIDYNENTLSYFASSGIGDQAYRYWRLYIEDQSNPNNYIEFGKFYLGTYYDATRGSIEFPFGGRYIDNSVTDISDEGQSYSDTRELTEELGSNWNFLTRDEKAEIDNFWSLVGTHKPFFIDIDPNEAFSNNRSEYIRYVKFGQTPSWVLTNPNLFQVTMNFREEI